MRAAIIKGGIRPAELARRFGLAAASAHRHHAHVVRDNVPSKASAEKAPVLVVPPEVEPLGEAEAQCKYLREKIQWAEKNGAAIKDVTAMQGQLGNWTRIRARLSGALDITEKQIAESSPWKKIEAVMMRVLAKHPSALVEMRAELAKAMSGE